MKSRRHEWRVGALRRGWQDLMIMCRGVDAMEKCE